MKLPKITLCFSMVLAFAHVVDASGFTDVFWLDRYGKIPWEDEKARLDNFSFHLLENPGLVGYIFVNAGRRACKGEAQARATRAKEYIVKALGVPWDRVVWRDLGYLEEPEVVLYLFKRNAPVPYHPEYQPAKEGQVIDNCSAKSSKRNRRASQ